jgi:hypothetical protein
MSHSILPLMGIATRSGKVFDQSYGSEPNRESLAQRRERNAILKRKAAKRRDLGNLIEATLVTLCALLFGAILASLATGGFGHGN